jgi:hypothetical protein
MLAYCAKWHMRRALAPLLFDEEDHEAAETQRSSIVIGATESNQRADRRRVPGTQPTPTILQDRAFELLQVRP